MVETMFTLLHSSKEFTITKRPTDIRRQW